MQSRRPLTNQSTTTLKENISNYLADYRMLNDYIQIADGRIINLSIEVDLFIDKKVTQSQVMTQVISEIKKYFDVNKYEMGENIYLSPLIETINNVGGVLNILEIRIYNKVGGGKYSVNEISQQYIEEDTRQIDISDMTLFGESTTMFEIKYPTKDIMIRARQ